MCHLCAWQWLEKANQMLGIIRKGVETRSIKTRSRQSVPVLNPRWDLPSNLGGSGLISGETQRELWAVAPAVMPTGRPHGPGGTSLPNGSSPMKGCGPLRSSTLGALSNPSCLQ